MNEFYKIMRVFKNGETATDVLPADKAKCLVGNSIFFIDGSEPNYIYVYEVMGNSPIMSVDTVTGYVSTLPGDPFQASVKDYVSKF